MLPELRSALKGGPAAKRSVPNIHLAYYGWTVLFGWGAIAFSLFQITDATAFEIFLTSVGQLAFWITLCSAWVAIVLVLEAMRPKLQRTSWIHAFPFILVFLCWLDSLWFLRSEVHLFEATPVLAALGIRRSYFLSALGVTAVTGFLGGALFHRIISRHTSRGRMAVHPAVALVISIGALFFQGIEERWGSALKHRSFLYESRNSLPLSLGVASPPKPILSFALSARASRMEDDIQSEMKKLDLSSFQKRSIYIIVVDSINPSSISAQLTPNMHEFFQKARTYPLAYSSAYDPEIAFVSLLTGNHSFSALLPANIAATTGSAPLRILRDLGYQTTVLSRSLSPELERRVLGNSRQLASRFETQPEATTTSASDLALTNYFIDKVQETPAGLPQFMVIQFSATRWPYEWPREFGATFSPYFEPFEADVLLSEKREKLLVSNRYANSARYVDAQVGRLLEALKTRGRYEDSVIAIIGSGAATFPKNTLMPPPGLLETHLSVPLAIRFGGATETLSEQGFVSTLHILPTVLHHLGARGTFTKLFDGSSVISVQPNMLFAVAANPAADPAVLVRKGGWKTFWNIEKDQNSQFKKLHLVGISKADDSPAPQMNFQTAASAFIEREFKELFGAGEPPADAMPFLLVPGN